MIRLKLYSAPYDPNGKLNDPGWERERLWQETFNDYLEHGWLRGSVAAAVMQAMEGAKWHSTEPYTYLDAQGRHHHAFMLKPATRFVMTLAESSRRGIYTWLPEEDADLLRADMVKNGWRCCDFRQFPALLKGFYTAEDDVGFAEAMRRLAYPVEVHYKNRTLTGLLDELYPQLEPKDYAPARLLQAIDSGLRERPKPFPDVPLPFVPRCAAEPALAGWQFTQRLLAEPYCCDGQTILPVDTSKADTSIVRLRITKTPDGALTLEQLQDRAADYDDLLRAEVAAMAPGTRRWTLVLATRVWYGWPEAAFLPTYSDLHTAHSRPVECDHEISTVFGFALDADAKTAELTEDAAALEMFRSVLADYAKQTQAR